MNFFAFQIGISTKTLYNHFTVLRRLGLILAHGDNLVLLSTKKAKRERSEKGKTQITFSPGITIQEIEARLYAKLIEKEAKKINFARKIENFEGDWYKRKPAANLQSFQNINLSARTTAKIMNVSQKKAKQLTKLMCELNIVKVEAVERDLIIKNVGKDKLNHIKDLYTPGNIPGHLFWYDNNIYLEFGLSWTFIEYPLKDRISYKQFKTMRKYKLKNSKPVFCKK